MNRKSCLTLLSLAVTTAIAQHTATAAEDPTLDAIVVSASRIPATGSQLPMSLTVVDEESLGEQLAIDTNILTVLDSLVPGLTVSQGEFRSGCRTNIRGRSAQFLINGVPTNDNLRRSNCGSLFGLSPQAVERVEVVRGSTALYGAGAPGGVINLITRGAATSDLEVDLATQWSLNPHEAKRSSEINLYAGAGRKLDALDYYGGIAFNRYGVRRDPNGTIVPGTTFDEISAHTSLGTNLGGGQLRLTGMYFKQNPDDAYTTDATQVSGSQFAEEVFIAEPRNPYEDQAQTTQTVLMLGYMHPEVMGHALDVSVYYHDEELIQRFAEYWQGDVYYFDSDADNERLGLRTALRRRINAPEGGVDLVYGIDVLRQSYFRPQVDPANDREIIGYVSPEVILDQYAAFLQTRWQKGRWQFTGGVRHERFDGEIGDRGYNPAASNVATPGETPDFDLTLFNAGVIHDLTDALQLYGGFSQGAEISEFGRAARGAEDPALINLDADASDQYEIGLRGASGPLTFTGAVFYSHSDKAADLQADPSCAGQPLCPLIPLRLERELHGVEVTTDWRASERTTLGALLTYQEGKTREPGAVAIPMGTDSLSPLRLNAYGEFEPVAGWRNRLQVSHFHKSNEYDDAEQALGYRNTDSYTLVDFTSSYQIGPGQLTLGLSNLLNEKYVNVTNQASGDFFYYLSEGRRATLGYTMRF